MHHMNIALLAKWVWRFGRENDSLWTRIICAKYGAKVNEFTWKWKDGVNASPFFKAVSGLLKDGSIS